ncbi:hypothetical protein EDD18DRAFT_1112808 [Armillaria luteobubalina]|uniref:C2H2-type domain-containing protein n=1 Tax=Armillaria luteobubalina TaxID=153913 RepID=A0AA39TDN2_9AGAR|nr:hypothetical protein EDD18DRAFT_1112808 [Armillaria luteobubalina]
MPGVASAFRPHPCPERKCKKSFTKKYDLMRHGILHLGKKEKEALYLYFSLLSFLESADFPGQHASLHIPRLYNIKNKTCSLCTFKTADSSELTRHKIGQHGYEPKERLVRQTGNETDENEDKAESVGMASPESPRSVTSLGMELDTPPLENHSVGVDMAVVPVSAPTPASMGVCRLTPSTPPPGLAPAPLYVASPPSDNDSDMLPPHSPSPLSDYRSMSYRVPPMETRPTDQACYLPSPPRSPSPHTSATSLLGLPAELFITGPRDCQLPRIMSYVD